MRHSFVRIATIGLATFVAACAGPAPTGAPATLEPSASILTPATPASSPTPEPTTAPTEETTEALSPTPTMTAFDLTAPDDGWAIAATDNASGGTERVRTYGRVEAGALLDFTFTCSAASRIHVIATDASGTPGETVFAFDAPCAPDRIGRAAAGATGASMTINIGATADSDVDYWVKLAVPEDHLTP